MADIKSCGDIAKLNFDFYKILSISLTDKLLIDFIKQFNKPIFISCGTANNSQIKKCVSSFNNFTKKKLNLIHTSLSYDSIDQNLKRIQLLKNYHSQISYGHHYKNYLPLIILTYSEINFFLYILRSLIQKNAFILTTGMLLASKVLRHCTN